MEIAHSLDSEQDLAMTGAAFSNLEQERLATLENQLILRRCTVFARANPLQKTAIVVQLKGDLIFYFSFVFQGPKQMVVRTLSECAETVLMTAERLRQQTADW